MDAIEEIVANLRRMKHAYEAGNPIVDNATYDALVQRLVKLDPTHDFLTIELAHADTNPAPIPLPSQDKIFAEQDGAARKLVNRFKGYTGPLVVSPKANGLTILLSVSRNGHLEKVFTHTQAVPHALPHFNKLLGDSLKKLAKDIGRPFFVRGESIMLDSAVDAVRRLKPEEYETKPVDLLAITSGTMNQKADTFLRSPMVALLKFFAFELITPPTQLQPSVQFFMLDKAGVPTVGHDVLPGPTEEGGKEEGKEAKATTVIGLRQILLGWRDRVPFDIDGIVVAMDRPYELTVRNPLHAFAFKSSDMETVAEVVVTAVIWTASKDCRLVPVVCWDPVELDGKMVGKATGHNAKNVVDRGIGIGARLQVCRSGQVIPYIKTVLARAKPTLPLVPCDWSPSGIDLMQTSADRNTTIRCLAHFFRTVDVPGLGERTVSKLFDEGFDSVRKIMTATVAELQAIPKLGTKSATNLVTAIAKHVPAADLATIMCASNCFGPGFAVKRLRLIVSACPDVLTQDPSLEMLEAIPGIQTKTAAKFLAGLEPFRNFLRSELPDLPTPTSNTTAADQQTLTMANAQMLQVVVFTGFRDKTMRAFVESQGGRIATTVSGKTTLLVHKAGAKGSKLTKARSIGTPMMTRALFLERFDIK